MRNSNRYATLWIWMFIFPLALDYKAPDAKSDHTAQLLLVAPVLGAGLVLALIAPRFRHGSTLRRFVTFALLLSVLGSVVSQFVESNPIGNYLRVLLPFMLFVMGYLIACHPWNEQRIAQMEKALYWANLVCVLFTFVFGMATGGALETVRYRIVSVTLLGLQGVLLHEFVVSKRFSAFTLLVFLSTIIVELLSVTRSLLVGTVMLFVIATWMSAPSARHIVKAALRACVAGVVIAAMAATSAWLFPSVTKHWAQRLFVAEETVSHKDPTTITRLAEIRDQYDQVRASLPTLLLGKGFGHEYHYSPVYLPDLAGQLSDKDFYATREWEAGHNFWVYQLFAGGILFGIGLPLAVLIALYRCALAYRRWRVVAPHALLLPALGRSILLLAALPATSIGGNPLGPRFSAVVFGVALGLAVGIYTQLLRRPETAGAPRAPRPHPGIEPSFGIPPGNGPAGAFFTASERRPALQVASAAGISEYRGTICSRPVAAPSGAPGASVSSSEVEASAAPSLQP